MFGLIEAFFIVGAWAIGAVRIPSVVMRERERKEESEVGRRQP